MTPKAKKNCSAKETSFELILMRRRVVLPASLEISRAASNLTVNQGTKPGFKRCNKIPNTRYKKTIINPMATICVSHPRVFTTYKYSVH